LLAAIEAFVFFVAVIVVIAKAKAVIIWALTRPNVLFVFMFSITFAFAVGVSTYNFGTLVRYKIPMLPFFAVMLILTLDYVNKLRKFDALESVE
jgi:hypothetical protein